MNDNDFIQSLRARAEATAPDVSIDTTGVIPRARRRRAAHRTVALTTAVVLVAGGGWAAVAAPWDTPVPVRPATPTPTPPPTETPMPMPMPTPTPSPTEIENLGGEDLQSLFWYQKTADGFEWWIDRSGRMYMYGYATEPDLPNIVEDRFGIELLIDSELVYVSWANVDLLPRDPAALIATVQETLRKYPASGIEPTDAEVREATPATLSLLLEYCAISSPEATRTIASALASLPDVRPSIRNTDALGRVGKGYKYDTEPSDTGVVLTKALIVDLTGGGILEERWTTWYVSTGADLEKGAMTFIENRASEEPPFSPTDVGLPCASWAECNSAQR